MSFISYEESQKRLDELEIRPLGFERVSLLDSLGRTVAEDIVASVSMPQHPTSALDGYAITAEDQRLKKIPLLCAKNPAGSDKLELKKGHCLKTFTGAVMPKGSDTLIPIERVSVEGDFIIINESVPIGFGVREVGESYFKGETLVKKGTPISYIEIGIMAALGRSIVQVYIKPRVSIIATGSELLDLDERERSDSQIYSSNSYTLEALAKSVGAKTIQLGICKDKREDVTQMFKNALGCSDIVISSGGVSVGDYDFVKDVVPDLGAETLFKGVKIKPGQHILVAKKGKKLIFALPGFAYSSTVTAILYILPTIKKMLGDNTKAHSVSAKITVDYARKSKKTEFVACRLTENNGMLAIDFKDKKSGTSAILNNLLNGAALLVADRDFKAGEIVEIIKI